MDMTPAQGGAYAEAIAAARKVRTESKIAGTKLPTGTIKTLFIHLRKIANHPLLVRNIYTEADLNEMAKVCQGKGLFGFEAGAYTRPLFRST
jgi:SWI/SNF-related matrix-associated actin-dependent regulator 1 of chromatin subfamily A